MKTKILIILLFFFVINSCEFCPSEDQIQKRIIKNEREKAIEQLREEEEKKRNEENRVKSCLKAKKYWEQNWLSVIYGRVVLLASFILVAVPYFYVLNEYIFKHDYTGWGGALALLVTGMPALFLVFVLTMYVGMVPEETMPFLLHFDYKC